MIKEKCIWLMVEIFDDTKHNTKKRKGKKNDNWYNNENSCKSFIYLYKGKDFIKK